MVARMQTVYEPAARSRSVGGRAFSGKRNFAIIGLISTGNFLPSKFAPLAQLDRASGYEPEGREFESLRAHHSFHSLLFLVLEAKSRFYHWGLLPASAARARL